VAHRPSPSSLFREPIVGIYDSEGILSSQLVDSAPPNQILRFPPSGEAHDQSLEQFFANKALFLETAGDLVIVLNEIESLSFLVSSIRALVDGLVRSLIIITDQSLREILSRGFPEEQNRIQELIGSGFLAITPTLTYDRLRQLLAAIERKMDR
jgi:hypothetical protein